LDLQEEQEIQDPPELAIQVQQEVLLQDIQVQLVKQILKDSLKLVPLDRLVLVEIKVEPSQDPLEILDRLDSLEIQDLRVLE
jgi:hypothetical protein